GRRPRVPDAARAEGGEGRCRLLARRRAFGRGARRPGWAPDVAPGRRSGIGPCVGRGPGVVLRSRPGPAPVARGGPADVRPPSRQRLHALPREPSAWARASGPPSGREPVPDRAGGGTRRGSAAGALPLLPRPRPARLRRLLRPAGRGRRLPG